MSFENIQTKFINWKPVDQSGSLDPGGITGSVQYNLSGGFHGDNILTYTSGIVKCPEFAVSDSAGIANSNGDLLMGNISGRIVIASAFNGQLAIDNSGFHISTNRNLTITPGTGNLSGGVLTSIDASGSSSWIYPANPVGQWNLLSSAVGWFYNNSNNTNCLFGTQGQQWPAGVVDGGGADITACSTTDVANALRYPYESFAVPSGVSYPDSKLRISIRTNNWSASGAIAGTFWLAEVGSNTVPGTTDPGWIGVNYTTISGSVVNFTTTPNSFQVLESPTFTISGGEGFTEYAPMLTLTSLVSGNHEIMNINIKTLTQSSPQ